METSSNDPPAISHSISDDPSARGGTHKSGNREHVPFSDRDGESFVGEDVPVDTGRVNSLDQLREFVRPAVSSDVGSAYHYFDVSNKGPNADKDNHGSHLYYHMDPDDLQSFERAVLARKTNINLILPRRRRGATSDCVPDASGGVMGGGEMDQRDKAAAMKALFPGPQQNAFGHVKLQMDTVLSEWIKRVGAMWNAKCS